MNSELLPKSLELDLSSFSSLLSNTTNSYKFLFLLSILEILHRRNFDEKSTIPFEDIVIEMLATAWYPHNYFKLSFGTQDKIAEKLDLLELDLSSSTAKLYSADKKQLRAEIAEQDLQKINKDLKRYVPYRLLRPFFAEILRGVSETKVDKKIPELAEKQFSSKKPLYKFDSNIYKDCSALIIHPEWINYFKVNFSIVKSWVCWEWLNYMQSRNPNTPAISSKLFPPPERLLLKEQRSYWGIIIQNSPISCIYSGKRVLEEEMALDHYVPWSFVVHDQLWNLVPTLREINSSKSNNLPSEQYFDSFIEIQHKGLLASKEHLSEKIWEKSTECFLSDLKIENYRALLDFNSLNQAYRSTILPLLGLAKRQGFQPWSL